MTVIVIGQEPLLTADQVAEIAGVNVTPVYRWMQPYDGNGRVRHHLESTRLGKKKVTTQTALNRFQVPAQAQPPIVSPMYAHRRDQEAAEKLRAKYGE